MTTRLQTLTRSIKMSRPYQTALHWRYLLREPDYRQRDAKARADFQRFLREDGGTGLGIRITGGSPPQKTALIVSQFYPPFSKIEAFVAKAFHLAGFRTVVLGNRRYDFLRYAYLVGNHEVHEPADFDAAGDPSWVNREFSNLRTLSDWLNLDYQGVHVGRFVVATALRFQRVGKLDFDHPPTRDRLRSMLESSVRYTAGAKGILDEVRPDCVLLMDRGYTGHGEVFDLAINRGIDTITWHLGHKSNRIMLKRYGLSNEREHPFSPSEDSWSRLRAIPWRREYADQVREDIFDSYKTQDWFSVVGTQFDKPILSQEGTRQELGLSKDLKTAVLFPHILWDGSFFYGTDLFDDYTQWFAETIRAAASNPRLQWVVKLHPAHVVKANQKNSAEKPAELAVIERTVGTLPNHVKLVYPEAKLSTYSLFEVADYVVTVRGTVGIEAALMGVPVLTAGTGRYDRRGFTVDSSSRQEYLDRLATLETLPAMSPEQILLAERYAFGVFCCRPLSLSSVSLEYMHDAIATPKLVVHCQTQEQWRSAPDVRRLAEWLAQRDLEDMLSLPEPPLCQPT